MILIDDHLFADADGGGAEALPSVRKTTQPQECSYQDAEGDLLSVSHYRRTLTHSRSHWP